MIDMDVFDCIYSRRSIRKFLNKEISNEDVRKILEAGRHAPSSGNLQNWRFIVVKNEKIKNEIFKASLNQDVIKNANVLIIACSDNNAIMPYGIRGLKLYSIQNVAAAIENMLLAANALGIGSCWVGAFEEKKIKNILKIPENVSVHAIICLGYPAENPKSVRMPIEKIAFSEFYGKPFR